MTQVKGQCTLDDEALTAFLSEIDADWVRLEPVPLEMTASAASISPRKHKSISSKKSRRYPRVDILNTRQEVAKLQRQLQLLRGKNELREMLQAAKSSCRLDWKTFASRERVLLRTASEENDQLVHQVDANSRLIRRTVKSIHRQMKTMPKLVQVDCRTVSLKNEAHVRKVMQVCLNNRSKNQLDTIVNECNDVALEWPSEQQMAEWNTFSLEDRGVGVDFHECIVLPFISSLISSAIDRWPSLNTLQTFKADGHGTTQNQDQWKATGLDRRLILRQIVDVSDRRVMLWQDVFCLQGNANSPSVLVRGSCWTLFAPVTCHEDELSVVHFGGLIQIQATEGLSIQPNDALAKDIVAYTQLMQRSRITSMEDVLIDANRQQTP